MEHVVLFFEDSNEARSFAKCLETDEIGKEWKIRIPSLTELEDLETFFLREQVKVLQKKKYQLQAVVQDREHKLHKKIDKQLNPLSPKSRSPSPDQSRRSESTNTRATNDLPLHNRAIRDKSTDQVDPDFTTRGGSELLSDSEQSALLETTEIKQRTVSTPALVTKGGRNNTLFDKREARKIKVQKSPKTMGRGKSLPRTKSAPVRRQEKLQPFYNKKKSNKKRRKGSGGSVCSVVSTYNHGKNTSSRASLFRVFDPDRNGKIVPKDFQEGLAREGVQFTVNNQNFQALWAFFDIAQKGWITYRDFQQLVVPDMEMQGFLNLCKALSEESPEEFLDQKNLKIRKQVHKKLVSQIRNETRFQMLQDAETTWELFKSMDVYKKGYVTFAEFGKVMAATAIFEISKEEEHALYDFICPGKELKFKLEDLEAIVGHDANAETFRFWAEEHVHQRRQFGEQKAAESSRHATTRYYSRANTTPFLSSTTSEDARTEHGEDVDTEDLSF